MTSLVDMVRAKSGASVADVTDARIVEALEETSVQVDALDVVWTRHPDGSLTREGRVQLGRYLVEASDTVDSVDPVQLHDRSGDEIAELSVTQRGIVTTSAASGALPVAYATGSVFDVHAAAAEIVEELLVLERGSYDFKRGDQSFARSQRVTHLESILRRLKARRIQRRRGEVQMRDQHPSAYWSE